MGETDPYGTFDTTVKQIREISQELDSTELTEAEINVYQDIAGGRIISATHTKATDWTATAGYKTTNVDLFNAAKGAVILIVRGFVMKHFGRLEAANADWEEARQIIKDITKGVGESSILPSKSVFHHR